MAYLNGKEILFSPKIHIDPATEEKLQAARQEGRLAEQSDFWDMFQHNGKRKTYLNAFRGWSAEYIRPKYKAVVTDINGCGYVFGDCTNLKKVEAQYFDFSQKPTGTNNNTGYLYTFDNCATLEEIEDIGLVPQFIYSRTFGYCYKLKTIAKMGVDENTQFANAFIACTQLENLTIEGTIGKNGFNLKDSRVLSKASITSVINALSEEPEVNSPTITLSKTAVENAFPLQDCLTNATYSDSISEGGLTITNNGDGSFTINGMYDGGKNGHQDYFFTMAQVNIPIVRGIYALSLEGRNDAYIAGVYTLGGIDSGISGSELVTPLDEPTEIRVVIKPNVQIDNLVIRPKLVYDEWATLIHHIGHFWTISLV